MGDDVKPLHAGSVQRRTLPYTREELAGLEAELDRIAQYEWEYGVEDDVNALDAIARRLLAMARAGLEDRERLDRLPELWDRISRVDDDSATWEVYHGHSVRNADGSLSAKLTLYDDLRAAIDAARDGGRP